MDLVYIAVDGGLLYLPREALAELEGNIHSATWVLEFLGQAREDFRIPPPGLDAHPFAIVGESDEAAANAVLPAARHTVGSVGRDNSAIRW